MKSTVFLTIALSFRVMFSLMFPGASKLRPLNWYFSESEYSSLPGIGCLAELESAVDAIDRRRAWPQELAPDEEGGRPPC